MNFTQRRHDGFTRKDLIAVLAVLAVMAALLLAAWTRTAGDRYRISCVGRLKNIGLAFRIWATDHQGRFPMEISIDQGGSLEFVQSGTAYPHFSGLSNMLSTPRILVCPADKKRRPATRFPLVQNDTLSYFVGLDARETEPQIILAGDRNLTTNGTPVTPGLVHLTTNSPVGWTAAIHRREGNIAMGDGSIQRCSPSRLAELLARTRSATNRLAVP